AAAEGPDGVLVASTSQAGMASNEIAAVNRALVERGFAVWGIRGSEPSLEEIFLRTLKAEGDTRHVGLEQAAI
ncbi:MAG TPA: hypothetical protein VGW38_01865, partial [Chloroflexota bacterium]|nr:hypothetical protein [Chloroflexota bacterium]